MLAEYIVARAPYRPRVEKLFGEAARGRVKLYVSVVTLSEALYVASRIYGAAGVEDPNEKALEFIDWVTARATPVAADEDVAVRAGELKKRLRIALPDCYTIATAQALDATPLFRAPEKEMIPVLEALRKAGVKFLDEVEA